MMKMNDDFEATPVSPSGVEGPARPDDSMAFDAACPERSRRAQADRSWKCRPGRKSAGAGRLALLLAVLPFAACTYAMEDFNFRTKDGETAFDRGVQSVEKNCWGTKLVDKERALIYSKWQAWPTGEGVYLSRCLVSMMPDTGEGGAKAQDVRLSFAMRKCPLADMDDVDKLAESCATVFEVPAIIADQVTPAARRIVTDITR